MIKLKPELVKNVSNGLDGLKSALQNAIELEHSTIPPYLYALYSIKPGTNQRIAEIIHSVVLEEMLHLSLCCNILNAIGGRPILYSKNIIPDYPSALPGSIGNFEVRLAPLSKALIKDVFMEIEEPETPLQFKSFGEPEFQTIGQFYDEIKKQILSLSLEEDIFIGDDSRQISGGLPNIIRVTDLMSANEAIDLIVEQGEGTRISPMADLSKPAHYYLFHSIYKGKELIGFENSYAYAGEEIPFDSSGIVPLITNPEPGFYIGTQAKALNDQFNETYSTLLKSLDVAFNGNPFEMLNSIGLMRKLKQEVSELTKIEIENGKFAGPTFTFINQINT